MAIKQRFDEIGKPAEPYVRAIIKTMEVVGTKEKTVVLEITIPSGAVMRLGFHPRQIAELREAVDLCIEKMPDSFPLIEDEL
jgi:hypothetical protein